MNEKQLTGRFIIKENVDKSKPKDIIYFPIILNNVNLVLETL